METFYLFLCGLGVVGSFGWLVHLVHLARHRSKALYLAELSIVPPSEGWPCLAVAFAARDEEPAVEAATRSILGQDYPRMEVIAVDDRSTDETGVILDTIAREDDRLRIVHVRELPRGWLGKTHALEMASETTNASWILFTDADVVFEPGALRKAIAFAEAERIEHLTVGPEVPAESVGERLFLSLFGLLFSMYAPIGRLENRRSRAHAGIGAFNLVKTRAFRSIGGFRHLSLSVDDDMRLAQALKFAGYRMRFLLGRGSVSVRWQVGLLGMVKGLEKNFFAGLGFRIEKVLAVVSGIITLGIAPFVGIFLGPPWSRMICGLGILAIATTLGASSKHSRIGWYYAFLLPIASVAILVSLLRSVFLTLTRGGVQWRGHLYPLRDLKRHVRLRDAWIREMWRSTR